MDKLIEMKNEIAWMDGEIKTLTAARIIAMNNYLAAILEQYEGELRPVWIAFCERRNLRPTAHTAPFEWIEDKDCWECDGYMVSNTMSGALPSMLNAIEQLPKL